MKETEVVCAVIMIDNLVYCCKRSKQVKRAGFWEFPGGTVNEGEDKEEALKHYIEDELNTIISIDGYLGTTEYVYNDENGEEKIILHAYLATLLTGMLERKYHSEGLFMTFKRLKTLKLLPPDQEIVKILEAKYNN